MKFNITEIDFCKDINDLNLEGIPLIQRRKMSDAARFAYSSVNKFSTLRMPIIFATNYGEILQCVKLLSQLSLNHLVSPNLFSISVLNAPVANLGILKQIHEPIYALSSIATVESALISAVAKLNKFKQVCVIAYEEFLQSVPCKKQCVAFIVEKGEQCQISIQQSNDNTTQKPNLATKTSIESFLDNYGKNYCFSCENVSYRWKFNAKMD